MTDEAEPMAWEVITRHLEAQGLDHAQCSALLNRHKADAADEIIRAVSETYCLKNPFPRWRFVAHRAWFDGVTLAVYQINLKWAFWLRLSYRMANPQQVKKRG